MEKGEGLKALIPAINNANRLSQISASMPCIIRYGLKGERAINGISYNNTMPGNEDLENAEIANIINYLYYEWSNSENFITDKQVAKAIKQCKED